MAPEWSYKSHNSNCPGKFQSNFDQGNKGNLVRVSREFEEFELKVTENWGEIQGKSDFSSSCPRSSYRGSTVVI